MSFPVDIMFIEETEAELNVKFPNSFKQRMIESNGGELITNRFELELFPFFDKTDRKIISRTCNHIGLETKNAKEWLGFPENAVAIGSDRFGNYIVLQHQGNGILQDDILFWDHETGECFKIGNNITELG